MFLNSRMIHLAEQAFQMVLNESSLKEGQQIIAKLKEKPEYERILAHLLSTQTLNNNSRLLAILEMKKLVLIQNAQSWWILRQIYMNDNERIAANISELCLHKVHFPYLSDFFRTDENIGLLQANRIIQLIHALLISNRSQILALYACTLEHTLFKIWQYYEKYVQIVNSVTTCLFILFHSSSVYYFLQDCRLKFSQHACLLSNKHYISKLILFTLAQKNFPPQIKSKYTINPLIISEGLSECLKRHNPIHESILTIIQQYTVQYLSEVEQISVLLSSYSKWIQNKYESQLTMLGIKTIIGFWFHEEYTNQIQSSLLTTFINYHANSIYNLLDNTQQDEIKIMYCLSFCNPNIHQDNYALISICEQHCIRILGKYIQLTNRNINSNEDQKSSRISVCMVMKMIYNFKVVINPEVLLECCYLIDRIARIEHSLSHLCYSYLSGVCHELMSINIQELQRWVWVHYSNLTQNQWGYSISSFDAILQLILYLFETCYFQSVIQHLSEMLLMCKIIINLLNQQLEVDHEILFKYITLLSNIINHYNQRQHNSDMNNKSCIRNILNEVIPVIFKLQLYTNQSANLYAYYLIYKSEEQNMLMTMSTYIYWKYIRFSQIEFHLCILKHLLNNIVDLGRKKKMIDEIRQILDRKVSQDQQQSSYQLNIILTKLIKKYPEYFNNSMMQSINENYMQIQQF